MLKARWLGGALVAAFCLGVTGVARADILWNWSFDPMVTSRFTPGTSGISGSSTFETGTFLTDGSLVGGVVAPGTYTIQGFEAISSLWGAPSGSTADGSYTPADPNNQFVWDGTAPTSFSSAGGSSVAYTYFGPRGFFNYVFLMSGGPSGILSGSSGFFFGPLVLSPTSNVVTPEPVSLTGMLLGLPLLGMIRRRRTR